MEKKTAEQAIEDAKKISFEQLWATITSIAEGTEENKAAIAETIKIVAETTKNVNNLSKNMGGLNNSMGELVESMFSPDLWIKFQKLGIPILGQSQRRTFSIKGAKVAEADVYLESKEFAIPVEIKTSLEKSDVDDHIIRMVKIRKSMDSSGDRRKMLGAVAGGTVPDSVRDYAHSKGFYVIVQNGGSASIANPPEGFNAVEW